MDRKGKLKSVFKNRFPMLLARICNAGYPEEQFAEQQALTSKSKDWPALLERWLDGLDLKPSTAYALTGFGDGSHILALLDVLPKNSYVFCGEESLESFVSNSQESTVSRILEDPRLFIGVGELDADFFESLSRIPILELTNAQALVFSPIYNQSGKYYASFLTEFTKFFDYWRKLYGTNVTASGRWQKNTFKNASYLIDAPDIEKLRGAFSGIPVIMVSAGPSLDISLEFVKGHESGCLIIAVNSSYRALRKFGIVPHLVIAADPYKYTDKGFEGVSSLDTALICPFIVNPKVVQRFQGRIFTWSKNNLLASYLRLVVGKAMGSEIQEIGTVSACVFDIAKIVGSPAIVFVGQDLAAKSDGQLHTSDSFYADLGANYLKEEECRVVPGNVTESVKVEAKLYVYLKSFELLAQKHGTDLELINTSEFGARIEGIPFVSFDEAHRFLKRFSSDDLERPLNRVREALAGNDSSKKRLIEVLESISLYGSSISKIALKGALVLEEALLNSRASLKSSLSKAESLKRDLEERLEGHSDLHKVMSDGALKHERTLHARAVQSLSTDEGVNLRGAEELLEYFWSEAEGAVSFYSDAESGLQAASKEA